MNYIRLSDVTIFIRNGVTIKQNKENKEGYPITRIETLSNDKFNYDKLGYASIFTEQYSDYYLKDGDVLLSHINSEKYLGRSITYFNKGEGHIIHGMNLLNIRFNLEKYNPKFFEFYTKSQTAKLFFIENTKHAVNQASISSTAIKSMPIPDFPIEKQNIIVNSLDTIIKGISTKKYQLLSLDELIKSRFIEMFVNGGYNKTQIRSVVDTKKISAKKKYGPEDTIKYIDISSIDNSSSLIVRHTDYTFNKAPSRAQQCLKNNDILVSTVRPNLKNIAIFLYDEEGYVGSSGFCVLRPEKCNPQYLKYIVLSDDFTAAMVGLTTGASYPAVRDDDVLNYEMIDAPIELQNEFASFVEQIDKSKFVYHSKYFLWLILTFESSTIAYSSVVSIFECPKRC